jgi:glycerophosphoryl diester phosphodiesterase
MTDNPWLHRRVIAYAHQGGAREAPSSTVFAIRRAIRAGATGIELDVHATADRELVVCHDATLERTTDGAGAIARHTLAELRRLDNAYHFVDGEDARSGLDPSAYSLRGRAREEPTLRIATLAEVLEETSGVALNLDIKQTAPEAEPYEDLLAAMLAGANRVDDVIVASFHDAALSRFHELAPDVGCSAGPGALYGIYRAMVAGEPPPPSEIDYVALQVPISFAGMRVVDENLVAYAHRAGLAVHVWTVDDEREMEELVEIGVDGIISDRPTTLVEVLERSGVAYRADR